MRSAKPAAMGNPFIHLLIRLISIDTGGIPWKSKKRPKAYAYGRCVTWKLRLPQQDGLDTSWPKYTPGYLWAQ